MFTLNEQTKSNEVLHNIGLNYKIKFSNISNILFLSDYAFKNTESNGNFVEKNNSLSYFSELNSKDFSKNNVYTAQAIFKTLFYSIDSKFGAKYSLIQKDNTYKLATKTNENDRSQTSLAMQDAIYASYCNFSKNISWFTLDLGLRVEKISAFGNSIENSNESKIKYNHLDFFPSISIDFSNDSALLSNFSLSYSRRISRPHISYFNNSKYYSDSLNYSIGNPNIKPTFINSYNFDISPTDDLNFSIGFRQIINDIDLVTIKDEVNPEINKTTFVNIEKKNKIGFNSNYKLDKDKWSLFLNAGISKYFITSKEIKNINSQPFWNFDISSEIKVYKEILFSPEFEYTSDGYTSSSFDKFIYFASATLSSSFFSKKLFVSISWSDIFKTNISNSTYNYSTIKKTVKSDYDALHQIRFFIRYNFNNFKQKFNKKSSNTGELFRI